MLSKHHKENQKAEFNFLLPACSSIFKENTLHQYFFIASKIYEILKI
jgi:hypothetical protein